MSIISAANNPTCGELQGGPGKKIKKLTGELTIGGSKQFAPDMRTCKARCEANPQCVAVEYRPGDDAICVLYCKATELEDCPGSGYEAYICENYGMARYSVQLYSEIKSNQEQRKISNKCSY